MKITINIEATAEEMREFLGLPDVQPLQDEMMQTIRDNIRQGVSGFDALTLMKPFLPAQLQSLETLQKALWDAYTKSGAAAQRAAEKTPETKK